VDCSQCEYDVEDCQCAVEKVQSWFETHEDEYLGYDKIPACNKPTNRSDLNAFIKLNQLLPSHCNIVQGAGRDVIYLDATLETLAKVATESDVIDLIRCGVMLGEYGLEMNV
jgi:predicted small secreted protein